MSDIAKAVCITCNHAEDISLSAWLHGQQFTHCNAPMRVHVDSPGQAEEAIQAALDDGLAQHEIVGALRAGITDDPVEAPKRRTTVAGSLGDMQEQLAAQVMSSVQAHADPATRHQVGAAQPTPLQRWAAQATLAHEARVRGRDYSVVVTAGRDRFGDEALAITVFSTARRSTQMVRIVVSPPAATPEASWDAWLLERIERAIATLLAEE